MSEEGGEVRGRAEKRGEYSSVFGRAGEVRERGGERDREGYTLVR